MESSSRPGPVRRPYHSPLRARQAEATRQRILDAARRLLASRGYAGTTLDAIAAAAAVSPKTVSAVFGAKRDILVALLSPVASGERYGQLVDQLRAAPEPRHRVEFAAQIARQVYVALGPEFELLRGAGAVASELAEVARQVQARRRQNVARLVSFLGEHGVLRRERSPEEVTDEVCALTGYDLYRALVVECGWAPERYEAWLTEILRQRLLRPESTGR